MRSRRRLAAMLACAALSLASLGFAGCSRVADYARVVEANRLHERGDYQGAIVAYLAAGRAFPATVDYDLANVYARLGEYAAASSLYSSSRKEAGKASAAGASGGIAADCYFNEGVALFERGRFEASWMSFRSALAGADPAGSFAIDARRNLELAWRAWKKSSLAPPRTMAGSLPGEPGRDESELRLLQRLETGRWKPGTAALEAASSSDY
jgi:tetratricopeptide (TPR) repeat protein